MKPSSRQARVDTKMIDDLLDCAVDRFRKKLSPGKMKDLGVPMMSHLATRCPSYTKLLKELKAMPEKRRPKI